MGKRLKRKEIKKMKTKNSSFICDYDCDYEGGEDFSKSNLIEILLYELSILTTESTPFKGIKRLKEFMYYIEEETYNALPTDLYDLTTIMLDEHNYVVGQLMVIVKYLEILLTDIEHYNKVKESSINLEFNKKESKLITELSEAKIKMNNAVESELKAKEELCKLKMKYDKEVRILEHEIQQLKNKLEN